MGRCLIGIRGRNCCRGAAPVNSRALLTGVAQWQSIVFQIRRLGVQVPPPVCIKFVLSGVKLLAKPENGSFWSELLAVGLYKRNQGRLARQLTSSGVGTPVVAGVYILSQGPLGGYGSHLESSITGVITVTARLITVSL